MTLFRSIAVAAGLLAVLLAVGCGGADGGVEAFQAPGVDAPQAQGSAVAMPELEASLEEHAASFLERGGSALRVSLHRFLGPRLTTELEAGSAVCRPGGATASITDPDKYPFACIVSADADGQGLQVGITLGFVGTELDGRCWRAANDRVSVTTTAPALLGRREAMLPVNQIAGCA